MKLSAKFAFVLNGIVGILLVGLDCLLKVFVLDHIGSVDFMCLVDFFNVPFALFFHLL